MILHRRLLLISAYAHGDVIYQCAHVPVCPSLYRARVCLCAGPCAFSAESCRGAHLVEQPDQLAVVRVGAVRAHHTAHGLYPTLDVTRAVHRRRAAQVTATGTGGTGDGHGRSLRGTTHGPLTVAAPLRSLPGRGNRAASLSGTVHKRGEQGIGNTGEHGSGHVKVH